MTKHYKNAVLTVGPSIKDYWAHKRSIIRWHECIDENERAAEQGRELEFIVPAPVLPLKKTIELRVSDLVIETIET